MHQFEFSLPDGNNISINIKSVVCIGYTGRNQEMVKKHIEELARQGIPAPPEVPIVYPVSNLLLTQEPTIQLLGEETSGEVEFVLLISSAGSFLTVGSDHTDRKLETYSIPYAKQVCPKPIAKQAWQLAEVLDHWDSLCLECQIKTEDEWQMYQYGTVESILPVQEILQLAKKRNCIDGEGTALFCGTVPIAGDTFQYATAYRITISDPVLNRSITHTYRLQILNCEGRE